MAYILASEDLVWNANYFHTGSEMNFSIKRQYLPTLIDFQGHFYYYLFFSFTFYLIIKFNNCVFLVL